MSFCWGCCGLFSSDENSQLQNQRSLLILPEQPCVAEEAFHECVPTTSSMTRGERGTAEGGETSSDHEPVGESAFNMEATSLLGKSDSNSSSSNLHTSSQRRSRRGRKKSKRKKEQQRQPEEAEAEGDPTSATGLMEEDEDDGEGEDELLVEKEEALRRFKSNTLKGDECPICLEVFTKDNPAVFLNCGHAFHLHCTYEWLERSATCAVCGAQVEAYEENDQQEGDQEIEVESS